VLSSLFCRSFFPGATVGLADGNPWSAATVSAVAATANVTTASMLLITVVQLLRTPSTAVVQ
jgi:hypothetical protein